MKTRLRAWWRSLTHPHDHERGDVPGWVMIVIMTAGLVIIIWGLAGEGLERVFEAAISRIISY